MRESATAAILAVLAGPARAAERSSGILDPAAITPRETFLAAGIGAMIACAVTSFLLAERVTERTHAALAGLVVLIGGFCLFIRPGRPQDPGGRLSRSSGPDRPV